ncbi:hypothetical protein TrVE_jg3441 [Triparma verrucosa]|uniref:Transmembrane protein n=1 Tax=Triparma verrucosa TaxID=1606542 RepID=A0A9W7ERE8_9STRA|nr:hypothetical protein TrVE_jg3441 [Triparma verrucosa]
MCHPQYFLAVFCLLTVVQGFTPPSNVRRYTKYALSASTSTKLAYRNSGSEQRGLLQQKGPIQHVSEFCFRALNLEPPMYAQISPEDAQCKQVGAPTVMMSDESSPALSHTPPSPGTPAQPPHTAVDPELKKHLQWMSKRYQHLHADETESERTHAAAMRTADALYVLGHAEKVASAHELKHEFDSKTAPPASTSTAQTVVGKRKSGRRIRKIVHPVATAAAVVGLTTGTGVVCTLALSAVLLPFLDTGRK